MLYGLCHSIPARNVELLPAAECKATGYILGLFFIDRTYARLQDMIVPRVKLEAKFDSPNRRSN